MTTTMPSSQRLDSSNQGLKGGNERFSKFHSSIERSTLISLAVLTACTLGLQPCAAKNKAVEVMKYLNPVPQKTYLNQSQDRIIKKKGFKTVEIIGAKPVENKELGFFVTIPLEKVGDASLVKSTLQRPDVSGLSVSLPWRMLEPVEGEVKFKPVDDLISLCKENNKSLILRISCFGLDEKSRSDTPDWVFQDPAVKSIVYTDSAGIEHQMPIFWDSNYLAKFSNLINELGEQYDKNPAIHSIGITGGGVAGTTNVVPANVAAIKQEIGVQPALKGKEGKEASAGGKGQAGAPDVSNATEQKSADASAAKPVDAGEPNAADTGEPKTADTGEPKAEDSAAANTARTEPNQAAPSEAKSTAGKSVDTKGSNKSARGLITSAFEKDYGITQKQLIDHWKYVADLFPKAFEGTRLNFDISPPTPNRKGEDTLDQIADYLVYRYGQRIYLSRPIKDGHHGFDDYRLLLKFHPDTLTGYRLQQGFNAKEVDKLIKNASTDGISFCEIPLELINSDDAGVKTALETMRQRMGYQLVSQSVSMPKDVKIGQKLTASFTFLNLGAAPAMRPSRQLDKDVASSFKVQLELRNENGAAIARLLHTPEIPTNHWDAGKPITWQEDLKMPSQLAPGKYDVFLSLLDVDTKRKVRFLNAVGVNEPMPGFDAAVGSIQVTR